MNNFIMNGIFWRVETVVPDSPYLIDRTNQSRLATTDPVTNCIYLSTDIPEDMIERVLVHELGHCAIFSYDLFDYLHSMVKPEYWVEIEEWVCNFIADYGMMIFSIAKTVLKDDALKIVSRELERLVA